MKSAITQKSTSPQPSSVLCKKQICMSVLDMAYRKFSITLKYKYQYQWTLIQLIQKQSSTINKGSCGQGTLRIFYFNQKNLLMSTIMNTQMSPSPQPSSSLWGGESICLVLVRPKEKHISHLGTSIRSSERWFY